MASFRAGFKLLLFALWILLWYPPVRLAVACKRWDWRDRLVCRCERGLLAIIGVRVRVVGASSNARPLMLVSNHLSYLDVYVLGSQLPLCFTPKSEVRGWPVIGHLAWLCGCIFIDRRPEKIVAMKAQLQQALTESKIICLFPESTTGSGHHLLPFKSSFFSLAEDVPGLTIQPVSIRYQTIHNLPLDKVQWPDIAWYGDMELAPHVWNLLKLGPIQVEVMFLPALGADDNATRKTLAAQCYTLVDNARNA